MQLQGSLPRPAQALKARPSFCWTREGCSGKAPVAGSLFAHVRRQRVGLEPCGWFLERFFKKAKTITHRPRVLRGKRAGLQNFAYADPVLGLHGQTMNSHFCIIWHYTHGTIFALDSYMPSRPAQESPQIMVCAVSLLFQEDDKGTSRTHCHISVFLSQNHDTEELQGSLFPGFVSAGCGPGTLLGLTYRQTKREATVQPTIPVLDGSFGSQNKG